MERLFISLSFPGTVSSALGSWWIQKEQASEGSGSPHFLNFIYFWICLVFIATYRLSLVVASWGYPLVAMHRLLTAVASLAMEHGPRACRLSSHSTRAYLLHGMWNLPRPGIEPVTPALVGRFLTTGPSGKSSPLLSRTSRWDGMGS